MIKLTEENFSIENTIEKMKKSEDGAIVTFLGIVRDDNIKELKIECYLEMAEKELEKLEKIARKKFDVNDIVIIHRYGRLKIKDNILLISVSSAHRKTAFRTCEFLIDEIKKVVPIWKEEIR